jgi:hypothetical protein
MPAHPRQYDKEWSRLRGRRLLLLLGRYDLTSSGHRKARDVPRLIARTAGIEVEGERSDVEYRT